MKFFAAEVGCASRVSRADFKGYFEVVFLKKGFQFVFSCGFDDEEVGVGIYGEVGEGVFVVGVLEVCESGDISYEGPRACFKDVAVEVVCVWVFGGGCSQSVGNGFDVLECLDIVVGFPLFCGVVEEAEVYGAEAGVSDSPGEEEV